MRSAALPRRSQTTLERYRWHDDKLCSVVEELAGHHGSRSERSKGAAAKRFLSSLQTRTGARNFGSTYRQVRQPLGQRSPGNLEGVPTHAHSGEVPFCSLSACTLGGYYCAA